MTGMISRRLVRAIGLAFLIAPSGYAEEVSGPLPDTSRLVTIGGSLTEIVYALGEEKRLVARDTTSVYPMEAMALPDVGYMRQLSPEGVLSVNPSGIIALQGSGPKEAVDVLKKTSVPYVEVPEKFDRAGVLEKIHVVGKAIGADARVDALAASVEKDLAEAEGLTANVKERRRVLFVLSFRDGRILASGGGTAAAGIIAMAGGVNAVAGFTGYKQLSDEALTTARPDVIVTMNRGPGLAVPEAELLALPAIAVTPAGKAKAVVIMDGAYLLGFGPRTASAVRDLAKALYGNAIGG